MKEFVEKLIERLDELQEIEGKKCDEYAKLNMGDYVEKYNHGECCYIKAIQIVNQLAEEYKHCCLCYSGIPCEYQNKNAILPDALLADKNGWIPVTERLPKPGKRYLVTAVWKEKDFEKQSVYIFVYGSDGLWHSYNYEPVSRCEIIAWQPLHEPYKPEEKQEETQTNFYAERFNQVL